MNSRLNFFKPSALAAILFVALHGQSFAVDCKSLPVRRAATGQTVYASTFGAYANDGVDDTAAIQAALDSLNPGDVLVFDTGAGGGLYEHNASLYIRRPNVIIEGNFNNFRGTNPADQAFIIQADGVEVRDFIINNVVDKRYTAPQQAAISVYWPNTNNTPLHNISLIYNQIQGDGTNYDPGTPTQASASGGIFIYNTDNFVIAGNTVSRSVADGIHMTAGSRNGRVIQNYVEEGGDDGIAVVSYLGKGWEDNTTGNPSWLPNWDASWRDKNIYIYNNTVTGNYWGRGITVIGGRDITVENNTSTKITRFAGIMIAHDGNYYSMGDNNVLVKGNTVSDIAKTAPTFVPKGPGFSALATQLAGPNNSGQGGIDVYGNVSDSDYLIAGANDVLSVRNVLLQNNQVQNTYWPGIRVGASSSHLGSIGLVGNYVNNPWTIQILSSGTFDVQPYCSNNTYPSTATAPSYGTCSASATPPTVTGFTCNSNQL